MIYVVYSANTRAHHEKDALLQSENTHANNFGVASAGS